MATAIGTKTRAALYLRVSTMDQGDGASLTTQKNDCLRYCQSYGLTSIAEFQDLQSGMKADRQNYQAMLREAEAGAFDVIVVWKLDRFGRDRLESGYQIRELQKIGVRVDSATEPNDSPLLRNILMDFAEEESRRISMRVSANKRTLAEQGKWTTAAPFGYRTVAHPDKGRTLEPSEDAPIIAEVFKLYAAGRSSLADLRDYVAAHSVSPDRPKTRSSVHKILKNPVYAGTIRYGRFSRSKIQVKSVEQLKADIFNAPAEHPAIVDAETYAKVQVRLQGNRAKANGRPKAVYLFTGLVWCECKSRYSAHRVTRGVSYYCNQRGDQGSCPSKAVSEKRIREVVLTPIKNLLAGLKQEDIRQSVLQHLADYQRDAQESSQANTQGAAGKLNRLEKRMRTWLDMVGDGEMSREEYAKLRAEYAPQIEELREQLEVAPEPDVPDIEGLMALADAITVETLDDLAWREIIEGMMDRIEVHGPDVRVEWKAAFAPLFGIADEG